jgi:hypothetical protein
MDQNFQTSFIPKKPIIEERAVPGQPVNIFTIMGIILLFAVGLGTGALYFYEDTLSKSIAKMSEDLKLAQNRFEPARITELKSLDQKLRASNEILSHHIAISPIFKALELTTLPTVRYTKFTYNQGELPGSNVEVKMKGIALGYRAVALQSDLFTKNKNIIDPVFSNLILDDRGNVLFELSFSVDSSFLNYKEELKSATAAPAM